MPGNPTPRSNHASLITSKYAGDRIAYQVQRVARALRLNHEDAEDLQQDLLAGLVRAMRRHDPRKAGEATFISRVLDLDARHLARRLRTRLQHAALRPASLSALDGCMPLTNDPRRGDSSEADLACQRVDVDRALRSLPRELRAIAEELKRGGVAEVARSLRLNRSSVYRAIGQIRLHFEACGIRDAA
jgi:RNA polymerase sigma-70 factor (ECF subfamily)